MVVKKTFSYQTKQDKKQINRIENEIATET